jgi:hypothetical protein
MKIYHFAENGEYLGDTDALESPREPEVFLVPRNATPIAPCEEKKGYARVFNGKSWEHIADNRGIEYWLSWNDRRIITELGEDVPEGTFLNQPPAPEREQLPSAPEPTKAELLEQLEFLRVKIESM